MSIDSFGFQVMSLREMIEMLQATAEVKPELLDKPVWTANNAPSALSREEYSLRCPRHVSPLRARRELVIQADDQCVCGDYRAQHRSGIGPCCFNGGGFDLTHGGMNCMTFRPVMAETDPMTDLITRLQNVLMSQMDSQADDTTPSSVWRDQGRVWLEGWFNLHPIAAEIRGLHKAQAEVAATITELVEAGKDVLIGGNHLALLIGADHPPYTADHETALNHYGAGDQYEVWCAWRSIMNFAQALTRVRTQEPTI